VSVVVTAGIIYALAVTVSLKWDDIETVGRFCLLDERRGTLVALAVGILGRTA
jgi:hypothetical protein